MRLLVTGSRHLQGRELNRVLKAYLELTKPSTVIHGAAPGVDTAADFIAKSLGIAVEPFKADWDRLHDAAGPVRNKRMLDEGKPDAVVAFHTDPRLGRGTANMVRQARAARVPVQVFILEPKR